MTTESLYLASPNMRIVKDCRDTIIYNTTIKLSNISNSTIRSDLAALAQYLRSVDQAVNNAIRKVIEVLKTDEVGDALSDYEDIDDPAVKQAYQNSLKQILTKIKEDIDRVKTEAQTPTFNLKTMSLTSNKNKLAELVTTNSNLQLISKTEKNEVYYDELLKQQYVLNESIKLFEGQSFFDRASPIIDQLENLANDASDSPANFKKTLTKEGIAIAKKVLKLVDDRIKYADMVMARLDIIKKIDERDKRADHVDQQIKACFEETTQLEEFEQLRDIKSEYVQEIEKIFASFNSFIDVVFSGTPTSTKDIADRFLANASPLRTYSERLFQEWLRV